MGLGFWEWVGCLIALWSVCVTLIIVVDIWGAHRR